MEANEIQMEDPTFLRSSVKKINQDIIEDLRLDQSTELRQRQLKIDQLKMEREKLKQQEENLHPSFKHRLREFEAKKIYEYTQTIEQGKFPINFSEIDKLVRRFPYFNRVPDHVRRKILDLGRLRIYQKDEIIFR